MHWPAHDAEARRYHWRQNVNITTWIMAGLIIGWLCFNYLGFNSKRGLAISLIVGMAGSLLGGAFVAPLLETVPVSPGDLNLFSLFTASAAALAGLTLGDMVHKRFGL